MNLERCNHSSCTIGKTLYVLGGYEDIEVNYSIEKLTNIDEPVAIASSRWQLIKLIESFTPRFDPVFCAWNNRELIILGGINEDNKRFNDGWVFDTRTDKLR